MKLNDIRTYGKVWAERLRLSEWDIRFRWMTKAESLEMPDCNGFCQWSAQHKTAWIAISKDCENIPHTCCHEILHLRISGHAEMTARCTTIPMEVAINALTEALLKLEGVHNA